MNYSILKTEKADLKKVIWLFEQVMLLQKENGHQVWKQVDVEGLITDIKKELQYKIVINSEIVCVFSIQYNDPLIWSTRDSNDAIYLHRIVADTKYKGKRLFEKVLKWSIQHALHNQLKFIRMDTWATNDKIIDYYKSFGFKFIENVTTPDNQNLPLQNRNLNVALLELSLEECFKNKVSEIL